jgi:uncharacterized protein YndB with AHSA1/START domain
VKNGQLEQTDTGWRLRYERRLSHSPEQVWRALTEREQLAAWFPTEIYGERAPGASLTFSHVDQDLPAMQGTMLRYEPPTLLEFTWGGDTLLFEVLPDGDGSRLTLVVGLDELGKASRDGAGWHECLDLLETTLAGGRGWPLGQHWRELAPAYVAAFGPAASTLGPPDGWQAPPEAH